MISYKLARELKDSGFSQKGNGRFIFSTGYILPQGADSELAVYIPTLSELIKACGNRFNYLLQKKECVWLANSYFEDDMEVFGKENGFGKTPEEAVANLWVVLNNK